MTTEVEGDDVVVVTKGFSDAIPGARMVAATVYEEQGGG